MTVIVALVLVIAGPWFQQSVLSAASATPNLLTLTPCVPIDLTPHGGTVDPYVMSTVNATPPATLSPQERETVEAHWDNLHATVYARQSTPQAVPCIPQ
jgi:hypothetical protein